VIVAFFHPNCSAGGGGERVLWKAIETLGELHSAGLDMHVVVYTTDTPSASYQNDLFQHVKSRFSISISPSLPISFVHLHDVTDTTEPPKRKSMVAQSAETVRLAWKALTKLTPHVYIDTTGCAFTFLVAKLLAGCTVAAYVHYPTISTDMLALVWERRPSYNNDAKITASRTTTFIKLIYYTLFAITYGLVGSMCSLVMVNSSWTHGHIKFLWRFASNLCTVFPPCDTKSLEDLPLDKREDIILSIGQFRPEKDHSLQLRSFALLLKKYPDVKDWNVKLALVGSCRGPADEGRVEELRNLAQTLDISKSVEFVLNRPYPELKQYLGRASVGIHTMWNEHFGIGVVEMMAAGLITIAHNSGGPKADILAPYEAQKTGYLASTEEEYAAAMYEALVESKKSGGGSIKMRQLARESASRFSDEVFTDSFKNAIVSSKILCR